jgi:hypothetical protein
MSDDSAVESAERAGAPKVLPMTKRCEHEQAVLFADILRKELRHMRSAAAAAEARWSRLHDGDVDAEPPERLERLRGRIQEASTLLGALNARFPANLAAARRSSRNTKPASPGGWSGVALLLRRSKVVACAQRSMNSLRR